MGDGCPVDSSRPPDDGTDSAEYLCHRLVQWTLNAPSGIAYVAYEAEVGRRHLEARWSSGIRETGLSVDHLDLSTLEETGEAIFTLKRKIASTESRVLSVTGFGPFLDSLEQDWTALNYRREEWFDKSILQVWWVPARLDEAFRRFAPDTYDWFLVRGRLAEEVRAPGRGEDDLPLLGSTSRVPEGRFDPEAGRRRSEASLRRFHRAYALAPIHDLVSLIIEAVRSLYESSLSSEAHDRGNSMLDHLIYGARADDWERALSSDRAGGELVLRLSRLARLAVDRADVELAERISNDLVGRVALVESNEASANFGVVVGTVEASRFNFPEAKAALLQAFHSFSSIGDLEGQATSLTRLADIELRLGHFVEARTLFQSAKALVTENALAVDGTECDKGLADVALLTGDFVEARRMYEVALQGFESTFNELGRANCLKGLGDVAFARQDPRQAETYFQRASPIYREIGNFLGEGLCIRSLGDIAVGRLRENEARRFYESAIPLFEDVRYRIGTARCKISLGTLKFLAGDSRAARTSYSDARWTCREIGDADGEAICLLRVADIDLTEGNASDVRAHLESAIDALEGLSGSSILGRCEHILGDASAIAGNFADADACYAGATRTYNWMKDAVSIGIVYWRWASLPRFSPAERQGYQDLARDAWAPVDRRVIDDFVRAAEHGIAESKREELRLILYVREQYSGDFS
jgi:tetratricopeptide (TPR) repeat protein